ncbi:MAG: FecR domain-containing protein [Pedobacter sp.]|uniref:FecR family protein n=1 Tax=Pedobacter sp. TaxID=1411316 RepID=UPI0035672E39
MEQEIINLFQKYMDRQCDAQELEQVLLIIEEGKYQEEWEAALSSDAIKIMQSDIDIKNLDASQASSLNKRILNTINSEPTIIQLPNRKRIWSRIAVAASILVIASLGLYFYGSKYANDNQNQLAYQNDIAPGKNGATLTLANGQKILIKDALAGNIATQSGVKISKTADGQIIYEITNDNLGEIAYNTLSTTRGEQTQVRLPDGTLVFLNAESSLKYPTSFLKSNKRQVSLTGEGYFEVAKDKDHPFIVNSKGQNVEVLGTHFNINAYSDEPTIKTTLLEGSVMLSTSLQKEILKPNEQAVMNGDRINIRTVDTEEIVAWKNNEFLFKNDDFRTNMRKIARWYNVEVFYEGDAPDKLRLGGFSSRSRNISEILKLMEKTGEVHFRIEGRKVHVSK